MKVKRLHFCCGGNRWCVADTLLHAVGISIPKVCNKHDAIIAANFF